ncbi:MAG: hypothetical protein EOO73_04520 [Myxococcales bacterium]|nr:MAG: hypothetical protein EOO73_04520 [Myxococcales bacterium]
MTSFFSARSVLALLGLVVLSGCTERQPAQELRSLSGSEKAVFLCRDASGVGRPFSDCPDRNTDDDDRPDQKLSVMALVSQTLTDEVAVVNVTDGHVIDIDPSTPGYGFLRVGGRPVSMAVTPGGLSSFVATAEAGKNGIFALPTRLLAAPQAKGETLDLTTWNACRLDETPGELAILVDSAGSCADEENEAPVAESGADLDDEKVNAGQRRKLVVSFPDSGRLGVIDAQAVLNRSHGSFDPCPVSYVELSADVPAGVAQTLPADLLPAEACSEVPAPMAPAATKRSPRPAGFAQTDGRLYVADAGAPVIHVLDTTNVCGITELSPLLPLSLRDPNRVVTTRRLAVSPLTPARKQYVYAIDAEDQPHATVMAFDVSPGSTDPTPIVRPGSPELPGEKPDRLTFGAPAHDVVFAYRDIPYVDPDTGAAEFGVRCSPDPDDATGPAALARPNGDFTVGARPGLLRGLFGFVLLTSGQIEVVDVDDLDADCRRPITPNPTSSPDFRGCANDEPDKTYVDSDGLPLTTNEQSCRVVEPHRSRSARLMLNNSLVGIRAPSLRTFPQLVPAPGNVSSAPEDRPRLLAVPFPGKEDSTDVFVGATLYTSAASGGDALPVDPNSKASEDLSSQNSLVLPPLEPRAYPADGRSSLTFEGALSEGEQRAGFLNAATGELTDASLSFCSAGVHDPSAMANLAVSELGLSAANAEAFGAIHGDFVQITSRFPDEADSYWQSADMSRADCVALFGEADAQTLLPERDLKITEAFAGRLVVRSTSSATLEAFDACFPTALSYRIRGGRQWVLLRGGQLRHDIVASGAESRCVRSCNPLYKWQKSRVFEVSSPSPNCRAASQVQSEASPDDALSLRVGCPAADEVACIYNQDDARYRSLMGSEAESCIFNGLTERFAVYKGRRASVRGESFTWQTTGGFVPLEMTLISQSTVVAPQSIQYLSQPEQLAVVDGASQGLSLLSLDTFGIVKPSPFY